MTRVTRLQWLERGLLGVGTALAVWCAVVLVEARFINAVPIPIAPAADQKLKVTQTLITGLPGEGDTTRNAPARTMSAGTLIGRLEAPSVRMSATVLEGTDDGTLRRGAGHIEDTPFPGQPGNIGIAGHRDTVFRPLRHIKVGDPLELTTPDRVYRYRINKTHIVDPSDVYVLDPTNEPTLTLVTCFPFDFVGNAPRRFIVHATLVTQENRTP